MDEEPHQDKLSPQRVPQEHEMLSAGSIDNSMSSNKQSSRRNRASLLQYKMRIVRVVSVDGSEGKYDIYEDYLMEDGKKSMFRGSNSSRMGSNNQNSMDVQENIQRRRSSTCRSRAHECNCQDNNCVFYHCACYATNEICLESSCCAGCVKMKMEQAIRLRGGQQQKNNNSFSQNCICSQNIKASVNGHAENCPSGNNKFNFVFSKQIIKVPLKSRNQSPGRVSQTLKISCSCKKSQCLKKYCICFASKKQCNSACECENCANQIEPGEKLQQRYEQIQRYSRVAQENELEQCQDVDIDQYFQESEYEDKQMPQSMEFDHPDFKDSFHNN